MKGLSDAQRRWMLDEAELCRSTSGAIRTPNTFPPSNTASVLERLGLWKQTGTLTPLGIQVRALLKDKAAS